MTPSYPSELNIASDCQQSSCAYHGGLRKLVAASKILCWGAYSYKEMHPAERPGSSWAGVTPPPPPTIYMKMQLNQLLDCFTLNEHMGVQHATPDSRR